MKIHEAAAGFTTDINGSDGYSSQVLFTGFRHVADMAGMYRTFRILNYGFTITTVNLTSSAGSTAVSYP